MSSLSHTRNTTRSFGSVTRLFHWLTALLILIAFPLGLVANRWPQETAEALAVKAQLFSIHKTLGLAVFLVALARILWALGQPRPAPLHPHRRVEVGLAEAVHWLLYASLVVVPLSGWVHHAALDGLAPIFWPFGQGLPFVPKSVAVATFAGTSHWVFTKLLALALLLHVAGAVKHHLVDRDATLRRMPRGEAAPADPRHPPRSALPVLIATILVAGGLGLAGLLVPRTDATAPPALTWAAPAVSGNWQVSEGTLEFTVLQMGQWVTGHFADWQASIRFDEVAQDGRHGTVEVRIATGSLALGSVSDQVRGPDFFDSAGFPEALFSADILPAEPGYLARGTLTLRGESRPVELPFTLTIEGNRATMAGQTTLDRRNFGIGATYRDEATAGFEVRVAVELIADRID